MRVLFQILIIMATHITADRTTISANGQLPVSYENSHRDGTDLASSKCAISKIAHAPSGSMAQLNFALRTRSQIDLGILKNRKGPKFQMSSFSGMACRITPANNPVNAAIALESHSGLSTAR